MNKWNPIDHMNDATAHKPVSGGKTYPRRERRYRDLTATMPSGSLARLQFDYDSWRKEWQYNCLAAVETALFAHEWEGFGI